MYIEDREGKYIIQQDFVPICIIILFYIAINQF